MQPSAQLIATKKVASISQTCRISSALLAITLSNRRSSQLSDALTQMVTPDSATKSSLTFSDHKWTKKHHWLHQVHLAVSLLKSNMTDRMIGHIYLPQTPRWELISRSLSTRWAHGGRPRQRELTVRECSWAPNRNNLSQVAQSTTRAHSGLQSPRVSQRVECQQAVWQNRLHLIPRQAEVVLQEGLKIQLGKRPQQLWQTWSLSKLVSIEMWRVLKMRL